MTFILASNLNRRLSMFGSFHFVVRKITGVYHLAVQMVGRGLLLSIPFLASSGGLYLIMLTQHDINYYLTEKPLEYWIAVSLIGTVLIVMALLLARLAVNWSIALPLHLFEGFLGLNASRRANNVSMVTVRLLQDGSLFGW